MPLFTTKPVTIEAMQFGGRYTGDATAILDWMEQGGHWAAGDNEGGSGTLYIEMSAGTMIVKPGEWIIKGDGGEFYPCKPDVFAATYTGGAQATGQISDGYHTFDELYAHRTALFAALMRSNPGYAWWAPRHADGTSFPGYILAGIRTPEGHATYHLPESAIPLMPYDSDYRSGVEWDGHTAADVIKRLASLNPAPTAEGFHPSHEPIEGPTNEGKCCAKCGVQGKTLLGRDACRGFPHSKEEQLRARRP
jgi:hypothetical protein